MSKKLEKSELEYIKDSFDSKTKNYIAICQKYEQREIAKAEMNSLVQENLETQKDLNKYIQKETALY